ncbi:3'-5' exonuclease [Bacillus sp. 7884-1]|uniref:3'-5' exonuclease n=1 Tax=Bacillus sp. 7884-1 TaxID=2021693 RepID=UPI000BA57544|nr:3'-5' exonuclease [Bacillus sp. 7884-1]PAE32022.1 hypothetical protein CHI06_27160 [Bacillus sp. 7884-1]
MYLYFHVLVMKEYQKTQIFERIQLIRQMKEMAPNAAVKEIRRFYDKYLEADGRKNLTMHKEMIQDTLSEIESSAGRFHSIQSFVNFVDEIIKKNKEMEELRKDPKADVVKLMTIHKSKGLEFPVVYLIGASENILPHSSSLEADSRKDIIIKEKQKNSVAIEGERRLAYVAITRAEEELYISSPRIYRDGNVEISRFIMNVFTEKSEETKKPNISQHISKRSSYAKSKIENTKVKEKILIWD